MANYIGPSNFNLDGAVQQIIIDNMGSSDLTITTQNTWSNTGLSSSITPQTTSSRVLITATLAFRLYHTSANQFMRGGFRVLRGTTPVWNTSGYDEVIQIREAGTEWNSVYSISFLDNPSTTSATTYNVQGLLKGGTGLRVYNYTRGGQLVLQEIGG